MSKFEINQVVVGKNSRAEYVIRTFLPDGTPCAQDLNNKFKLVIIKEEYLEPKLKKVSRGWVNIYITEKGILEVSALIHPTKDEAEMNRTTWHSEAYTVELFKEEKVFAND